MPGQQDQEFNVVLQALGISDSDAIDLSGASQEDKDTLRNLVQDTTGWANTVSAAIQSAFSSGVSTPLMTALDTAATASCPSIAGSCQTALVTGLTNAYVTIDQAAIMAVVVASKPYDPTAIMVSMTPAMCSRLQGTWYTKATNKQDCLNKGHGCCKGTANADGSCSTNQFFANETESSCASCPNADYTPKLQWMNGGNWVTGDTVQKGVWTARKLASTNQWTKSVNPDALTNAFENAIVEPKRDAYQQYATCKTSYLTNALSDIALNCGFNSLDILKAQSAAGPIVRETIGGKAKAFPGTAASVKAGSGSLSVQGSSISKPTTLSTYTTPPDAFSGSGSQRTGSARILRVDDIPSRHLAGTSSTASCYTVVTNSASKLVGQLIGTCVRISADQAITGSLLLCLATGSSIPRESTFSVLDFATLENNVFTPVGGTATMSGLQLCMAVTTLQTFCPIARYSDYTTRTTSADGSCGSLDATLMAVNTAQLTLGKVAVDFVPLSQQSLNATGTFNAAVEIASQATLSAYVNSVQTADDLNSAISGDTTTTVAPTTTAGGSTTAGGTTTTGHATTTQAPTTTQGGASSASVIASLFFTIFALVCSYIM